MKQITLSLVTGSLLASTLLLSGCGESATSNVKAPKDTSKLIRAVADDATDWTWQVGTDGTQNGNNAGFTTYFMQGIPNEVKHFQYFLDTDNNANTGFSFGQDSWRISGADILVEDGAIYQSQSKTQWKWNYIGQLDDYTRSTVEGIEQINFNSNKNLLHITSDTVNVTIEPFDAAWGSTYSTISTQAVVLVNEKPAPLPPTLYEDFESGNLNKWTIDHDGGRASNPPKMEIVNGFDGSNYAGHFFPSYRGSQNTYKLLMPNDKQFVLEADITVSPTTSRLSHGIMGVRVDTIQGPRLIYWDAYRNQRHRDANNGTYPGITYYEENFAIVANGNPAEPTEKVDGLQYVHFKVDMDEYLQKFEPNNHVTRVYYYLQGDGDAVDNITLSSQQ